MPVNRSSKRVSSSIPLAATMEARDILAQYYGKPKRHKYRAVPTTVDGIRFDSKREAERYSELKLLQSIRSIWNLELQPRYPLHSVNMETGEITQVGTYVADFKYSLYNLRDDHQTWVVEDSKGYRTPSYRLKKKMVEAEYGIVIREV